MTKTDPSIDLSPLTESVVTGLPPERVREQRRRRNPFRKPVTSILRHVFLIAAAVLMLYPVIWMVVSSFRPTDLIFREAGLVFDSFEISNYVDGWNALTYPFNVYLLNSGLVVIGSIIGNLVSCSLAAYAFARLEFTGKKFWFAIMLLSIMLPIHVIIVPQYVLFSQLGWVNTFLPLIVPKLLATDAFFIFLMVQFIRGIPRELDEAARIDGAGHPRIFLQIILPLMVPALATVDDLHLHLDLERLLQPAHLPDEARALHGAARTQRVPGRAELDRLRRVVRDERRVAHPHLPDLPLRPAIPDQGHRDDGDQVIGPTDPTRARTVARPPTAPPAPPTPLHHTTPRKDITMRGNTRRRIGVVAAMGAATMLALTACAGNRRPRRRGARSSSSPTSP